ncbi:SRR1-like protein isoform X2 [Odocoileus virginianus]|uniref:SRR1-like protein isoform X2 n=1 Tax=Odocoileus virginianus TaxID=9874 RepID=A0ABM4IUV6_ODOVR
MAAAAAAREAWQAASPRRRRSAARRPKRREAAAAAGNPGAEPEVEGGVVLRRIQEAKCKSWKHQRRKGTGCSLAGCRLSGRARPVLESEDIKLPVSEQQRSEVTLNSSEDSLLPGRAAPLRERKPREPQAGGDTSGAVQQDLVISDFWSSALETITGCLQKHLEQLRAPEGRLSEALGHLHLDAPPVEADTAPGSIPEETLVPATCRLKCVCYGVGNFASCATARSQLAFLLLLLERCQVPRSHCWVYDPLFSQLEIAVLSALGVVVLRENEEGKRSVCGEPTVFYMPHCGTALYNNLLWRNWSVDALSKVVIVGNSFRGLEERLLTRILHKHYPYVAKILTGLEEVVFPQTPRYMDVFNDTSIHWFPVQKLTQLPTDTWAFREEPDYQDCEDLEIIRKKSEEPPALT